MRLAFPAQPLGGEADGPERKQERGEQREDDPFGKDEKPAALDDRGITTCMGHLQDGRFGRLPGQHADLCEMVEMLCVGRAFAARIAPVCHAPTSRLRVESDNEQRHPEQPQRDPDHQVRPRLALEAEPTEVTPGTPRRRGCQCVAHVQG